MVRPSGAEPDDFGNLDLMGVANHPCDPRQSGQLRGRPLSVTARDQDPRGRVFAPHAIDRMANVLIGR